MCNQPGSRFLAGINVRRLTVVLYMLSGMFAALAGIVLVGYSGQPTLGMGDPFLFQSIAAIVIGGVSTLGLLRAETCRSGAAVSSVD